MQLRITHDTHYRYTPAVETAQHVAHLHPAHTPCQSCMSHDLKTEPAALEVHNSLDAFGNHRAYWALPSTHSTLRVLTQSLVYTRELPIDESNTAGGPITWEAARDLFVYHTGQASEPASAFVFGSHHAPVVPAFAQYAQSSFTPDRPLTEAVRELMQRIHQDFVYESFSTDVSTPALTVLQQKRGVCQDFAHVMRACLRSLGLAARYVSGYLLTQSLPGQERLVGSDASHAWISVFVPGEPFESWHDFDPTNNRDGLASPGQDYVRLAVGRDFADVSPLRGVLQGGTHHILEVGVTVEQI